MQKYKKPERGMRSGLFLLLVVLSAVAGFLLFGGLRGLLDPGGLNRFF